MIRSDEASRVPLKFNNFKDPTYDRGLTAFASLSMAGSAGSCLLQPVGEGDANAHTVHRGIVVNQTLAIAVEILHITF